MPTLFVRCRACRTEFPTRLAVGDVRGSTLVVSGLSQRCAACGTEELYFTKDVFVPANEVAPPTPHDGHAGARDALLRTTRDAGARFWSWLGIG